MKIDVYRKKLWDEGWQGELWVDGQFECYTVEPHPTKPLHQGHPCIPAGVEHDIHLTLSPHFGYLTPEVLHVENRTAIRIHRANWPKELLGCTGVGRNIGDISCMVTESEKAFNTLMTLLNVAFNHGEKITAEWHDPS